MPSRRYRHAEHSCERRVCNSFTQEAEYGAPAVCPAGTQAAKPDRSTEAKGTDVFEIEVQNESNQTQQTLRFVAVPRIGEGVRLLDFDGLWASYDVIDVWYQQSPFGEIWVPYMHVRRSGESAGAMPEAAPQLDVSRAASGPSLATAVAAGR